MVSALLLQSHTYSNDLVYDMMWSNAQFKVQVEGCCQQQQQQQQLQGPEVAGRC
jgi:hypothetical protein